VIAEGSCDTDAENSALITGINYTLQYIRIENGISQHHCFYGIFHQINAALVNVRDFFENIENLTNPKLLSGSCE